MKKLLASLTALLGLANTASSQSPVQMVDPRTVLFTTPTLSNDAAPLNAVRRDPTPTDFVFHEDEWSQLEFLPKTRLAEIQRLLKEFKAFEQRHRTKHGWREVYVRRLDRKPVLSGAQPIQRLEKILGARGGASPLLFSAGSIMGEVKGGFSIPLGGNVTVYGYVVDQGIPVLGAIVGKDSDDFKLTQAFMKLNADQGFVLVDWRAQLVLVSVTSSGQIDVWKP